MKPPLDGSIYTTIIFLIFSITTFAIFAFSETAITALSLFRVKELSKTMKGYARLFGMLENRPHMVLITILVASNLANVTTATLSGHLMENLSAYWNLPESLGFAIGIGLTTLIILIAELIPKNIAKSMVRTNPDGIMFHMAFRIINLMTYVLYPFVFVISRLSQSVLQSFKTGEDENEAIFAEKEIQLLVDYINERGLMERHKINMIKSIFKLENTLVKDVMTPESSVVSIDSNMSRDKIIKTFCKYQYTRLPVYNGESDNVLGMLHQKDYFQVLSDPEAQGKDVMSILRPIIFVPETARVIHALKEFREKRIHIAMVINEFGSIIGLVTLEDLLEEIVGEIVDEYEAVTEKIVQLDSDEWLVDGSIEIKDLSIYISTSLDSKGAVTLSGFLTENLQHVPKEGDIFKYKDLEFSVKSSTPKKVDQVIIKKANQ